MLISDIDECLASPCDTNANCTNVVGSYICQCLDGYTGDGLSCAGKRLSASEHLWTSYIDKINCHRKWAKLSRD